MNRQVDIDFVAVLESENGAFNGYYVIRIIVDYHDLDKSVWTFGHLNQKGLSYERKDNQNIEMSFDSIMSSQSKRAVEKFKYEMQMIDNSQFKQKIPNLQRKIRQLIYSPKETKQIMINVDENGKEKSPRKKSDSSNGSKNSDKKTHFDSIFEE